MRPERRPRGRDCQTAGDYDIRRPDVQKRLVEKLKQDWSKLDSRRADKIDRTDGLKMICEDGSCVLMRLSGTEPVVRVYCEAPSEEDWNV